MDSPGPKIIPVLIPVLVLLPGRITSPTGHPSIYDYNEKYSRSPKARNKTNQMLLVSICVPIGCHSAQYAQPRPSEMNVSYESVLQKELSATRFNKTCPGPL